MTFGLYYSYYDKCNSVMGYAGALLTTTWINIKCVVAPREGACEARAKAVVTNSWKRAMSVRETKAKRYGLRTSNCYESVRSAVQECYIYVFSRRQSASEKRDEDICYIYPLTRTTMRQDV